jgi:hypothetical protein
MADRVNMKTREDIKRTEGAVVGMIFMIIAIALFLVIFILPGVSDAHMGQAGTSKVCMECHAADHTSPTGTGLMDIAVDGIVTTSATLTNDGVDTIEIDFKFYNMANGTPARDSKGVLIGLPTGQPFTLANGTVNSPAITGWNSVWDAAAGVGWDAAFQTNSPANCGVDSHDCYKINFGGSAWDHDGGGGGNDNTFCDIGGTACNTGLSDLDGVADTMGFDAVISTTAAPGPYTIYLYGIGHNDGGTKGYIVGVVNVTVTGGANTPPTITVNDPDGVSDTVTQGASYNINYDLADAEEVVTAAFYYDTDAVGLDGTPISGACAAAPEGTGVTCSWDTTGVTPGTYYVYGIADDGIDPAVNDYSPGQITIDPAPNNPPTLTVNDPDGVGDNLTQGNIYNINYDLADTEETVTVAFYYDTDNVGLDGTAISGACATAAEGTGVTCSWDTTGIPVASYYIYGITDDGVNPAVNDYSPGQVTINAPNTAPTLAISQPDGVGDTVAEGTSFNITYTMTDPDDIATVDFYYDTDNIGADGTAIGECATQAEGTTVTCSWNTAGEAGTWYVYGIADDGVNAPVTSYTSGTITINVPPTIAVNQPDGVSDTVMQGDAYNIDYDLADSDDAVTAAFYYDSDNIGLDGAAITGACATAAEGTGVTCSWDTTGVTPGSYYVYGTTNDGVSPAVSNYSTGQITIEAEQNPNSPSGNDQYYTDDVLIKQNWYIRDDIDIKIKATASDPNSSQQVRLIVDVELDASVYGGESDCTGALSAQGAIEVTCSNALFTDGNTYKWRVKTEDENANSSTWVDFGTALNVRANMDLGVDAGPNTPPTITVNQPSGNVIAQGTGSFNINYDLSDPDNAATAAFYYDTNSDMAGGTPAANCGSAPEGTGVNCAWNTSAVAPGTYWIYGDADDGVNPVVQDLSPGTITINAAPTLSIAQPDGVSDSVPQGSSYNITYTLNDSDDTTTVAFYYDTNNSGLDGTAISGACATAAEGTGVTCSWDRQLLCIRAGQ